MAEKQNQIKQDMVHILRFSSKYNFRDANTAAKVSKYIEANNLLTSVYGEKYRQRLAELGAGTTAECKCIFCTKAESQDGILCSECMNKYSGGKLNFYAADDDTAGKTQASADRAVTQPQPSEAIAGTVAAAADNLVNKALNIAQDNGVDVAELQKNLAAGSKYAKEAINDSVDKFTEKINTLAGGEGKVELRFKDLFTDVLKKHTEQEAEKIFICGTSMTTPAEEEISAEWPRPWLYTRVALWFAAAYLILMSCFDLFSNMNVVPGIIFIGSFMIPVSLLIFFFEVNAPRNISIFSTIKTFFIGGAASLLATLILFSIVPIGELDFIGAILVGVIEEVGKLVIVAWIIKKREGRRYILNAMLIGAAVGGGFAAFESAGYAMRYFMMGSVMGSAGQGYDIMMNVINNRAILSPGGHIAWAAISAAALVVALGQEPFEWSVMKQPKFISIFVIPVIMHAIWDMPIKLFSIGPFAIQHIALIVIVWIILLVFLQRGLEEC